MLGCFALARPQFVYLTSVTEITPAGISEISVIGKGSVSATICHYFCWAAGPLDCSMTFWLAPPSKQASNRPSNASQRNSNQRNSRQDYQNLLRDNSLLNLAEMHTELPVVEKIS